MRRVAVTKLLVLLAVFGAPGMALAQGLGAPLSPGDIVVTDTAGQFGAPFISAVIKIDPVTGAQSTIARSDTSALPAILRGVAVDASGDIFVAGALESGLQGMIVKVDAVTGIVTIFATGASITRPVSIIFDTNGDLLVGDRGSSAIVRLDSLTAAQTVIFSGGLSSDPEGMVLDGIGNVLVTDPEAFVTSGGIFRINLSTGAETVVSSGVSPDPYRNTTGIIIDSNGDWIVVDGDSPGMGGLFRVNPSTGAAAAFSFSGLFVDPRAIVARPDGNFLVTDSNANGDNGAVILVDRVSGAQSTFSDASFAGSIFNHPWGIALFQTSAVDTTPPVITLNGGDVTLECGADSYTEQNATAVDDVDGAVAVVIGGDVPDPNTLGLYVVTYDASDSAGNAAATVFRNVLVQDTTPPTVTASAFPDVLWPPNHKLEPVTCTVVAADACDASPTVSLVSITSDESDNGAGVGDGNTSNDMQAADGVLSADDTDFLLRSERQGRGDGRVYTITYSVTDASGNSVDVTCTVEVPKTASSHSCGNPDCDLNF